MSRIGVIFCAYNTADLLPQNLAPWLAAREQKLNGYEFVICGVSCPFTGFDNPVGDDGTIAEMFRLMDTGRIDNLVLSDVPIFETEARGRALRWLEEQGVTYIWQVDSDENYTTEQITNILWFILARPYTDWFRLCLRNAVFTPDQFLVEPFTPPRIHKAHNAGGFVAAGFHQDNNVYYERPWNGERVLDTQLSSVLVPKSVAWILHLSWLSDERSRRKVEYQTKSRGWNCSFSWDYEQNRLIFNPALPAPEVARDE